MQYESNIDVISLVKNQWALVPKRLKKTFLVSGFLIKNCLNKAAQ